jgi:hypothetical protein
MASTTSLPDPTFTKPITSMTIAELRQTCTFFELPSNGITPTIRNRLQNFLTAHKQDLQHDYDYVALYPNRDPLPIANRLADDPQDSHTFSQWNGIGGGNPAPQDPPHRAASIAAGPANRVEEYLQGKSSHLRSLAPLAPHILSSLLSTFSSSIEHYLLALLSILLSSTEHPP